ncbi:MAG: peptidylprolyl isomerase [Chloroflexi bacterium]|nr:MAG: peptidylprolyl isomerase [Chloroflexota bacterium]
MRRASALAGALFFILSCTVAQQPSPSQATGTAKRAIVELAKGGSFTITLRADAAPSTVANFVQKARDHKYDGLKFHRVEDWVVQGGDPLGSGMGGGKMPSEMNQLPFKVGAAGIARGNDPKINNDYQWFVVKKDASWLNGQYTNFGQVESGMDVVTGIKIGDVIKTIRVE